VTDKFNPALSGKLSDENAKWRIKNRELREDNERLKAKLRALEAGAGENSAGAPAGDPKPVDEKNGAVPAPLGEEAPSLAEIFSAAEAEPDDDAEEEERLRKVLEESNRIIASYVGQELAAAGAIHPEVVLAYLERRGLLDVTRDGVASVRVGEDLFPLSRQTLARVIPADLIRAAGKPGMGQVGAGAGGAATGLDPNRWTNDVRYFAKHRHEIQEQINREMGE
jgi:hypothetical protein